MLLLHACRHMTRYIQYIQYPFGYLFGLFIEISFGVSIEISVGLSIYVKNTSNNSFLLK